MEERSELCGWHCRRSDVVVGVALLCFIAVGTVLRIQAVPERYRPHEHQRVDVHRYYVSTAESFLAGRGWNTDYRENFIPPPLQAVFVALVRTLDPDASYGTMRSVQAWLSVLTILLAFWIGVQMAGRSVGFVAAALIAIDSELIDYVGILLPENNYILLLFAFLGVLLLAVRREKVWLFSTSGALLGLTSLMKPFPMFLSVVLPALFVARHRNRRSVQHALAFFLAFAFVISPWVARNYLRYDHFYLISTNGGTALALSNFAKLDASKMIYHESIVRSPVWRSRGIEALFAGKRDEEGRSLWNERDRVYFRHTIAYILDQPAHFLRNYFIKVYNIFRYNPRERREHWMPAHHYRALLVVLGLPGLIWFAVAERNRPQAVMIWIVVYFTAFLGLFYISTTGRIQLPVKILLTFFAAYLVVSLPSALRTRRAARAGTRDRVSPASPPS